MEATDRPSVRELFSNINGRAPLAVLSACFNGTPLKTVLDSLAPCHSFAFDVADDISLVDLAALVKATNPSLELSVAINRMLEHSLQIMTMTTASGDVLSIHEAGNRCYQGSGPLRNTFTINLATDTPELVSSVEVLMFTNKTPLVEPPKAHLVVSANGMLNTRSFEIKRPDGIFDDLYDEPVLELMSDIIGKIRDGKTGVALLHGDPGTGKTSFIRELIHRVPTKTFLVVPPELFEGITGPQFMQFMLQHQETVLIIEDAEKLLLKRGGESNIAISTLLNMSDGLLADALAMPILCTFNSPIGNVDDAVLRPGRLIGRHEFKGLSPTKSMQFLAKRGFTQIVKAPVSVATLFEVLRLLEDGNVAEADRRLYAPPSFGFGTR